MCMYTYVFDCSRKQRGESPNTCYAGSSHRLRSSLDAGAHQRGDGARPAARHERVALVRRHAACDGLEVRLDGLEDLTMQRDTDTGERQKAVEICRGTGPPRGRSARRVSRHRGRRTASNRAETSFSEKEEGGGSRLPVDTLDRRGVPAFVIVRGPAKCSGTSFAQARLTMWT